MARKPRQEEDTGTWMNTYSDLVTLLMTFFVLLFSMSSVDAEKWEQFVKAFVNPGADTAQIVIDADSLEAGDEPLTNQGSAHQLQEGLSDSEEASTLPTDFNDLFLYLQKYVEENNLESSIQVMKNEDESVVYIRFQNNIFFDPDESYLRAEAYEILSFLGDCLYSVEDEIYLISINGHTADVNDPNYAVSDWMLSGERASRVADYFDSEKNITPTKLRPMGYGKNFPVASNDTPEGKEQNRRVDMTIVKNNESGGWLETELASLFDPAQFPRSGGAKELFSAAPEDGSAVGAQPEIQPEDQTDTQLSEASQPEVQPETQPEAQPPAESQPEAQPVS